MDQKKLNARKPYKWFDLEAYAAGTISLIMGVGMILLNTPAIASGDTPADTEAVTVAPPIAHVSVEILDTTNDDGNLLEESRSLALSLLKLDARLSVTADRARILGDGEMLACVSTLESDVQALRSESRNVHVRLLQAITEEDNKKRLHGIRQGDIIRARAHALDVAEDRCFGAVSGTYVSTRDENSTWFDRRTPDIR